LAADDFIRLVGHGLQEHCEVGLLLVLLFIGESGQLVDVHLLVVDGHFELLDQLFMLLILVFVLTNGVLELLDGRFEFIDVFLRDVSQFHLLEVLLRNFQVIEKLLNLLPFFLQTFVGRDGLRLEVTHLVFKMHNRWRLLELLLGWYDGLVCRLLQLKAMLVSGRLGVQIAELAAQLRLVQSHALSVAWLAVLLEDLLIAA